MNKQLDNTGYEFLWQLLANPADNNHSNIYNLQLLVNDYPHSGILHALLMPNGDKENIKHAAAYFNPVTLHKLATAPDSLGVVTAEQFIQTDWLATAPGVHYNLPVAEAFIPPVFKDEPTSPVDESLTTDHTELGNAEIVEEGATPMEAREEAIPFTESTFTEMEAVPVFTPHDEIEQVYTPFYETQPEPTADTPAQQDETTVETHPAAEPGAAPIVAESATGEPQTLNDAWPAEEENALTKEYNEYQAKHNLETAGPITSFDEKVNYFHQDIEDEIFEEIVSIEDISLEQLAILNTHQDKRQEETVEKGDSYFVFEPVQAEGYTETAPDANPGEEVNNDVSKYNDDKMPYTFMWWLDKTRKEHAGIYQPYISTRTPARRKKKPVADELQQQYYEHIVSENSINELDKTPTTDTTGAPVRKLDKIVERFMHDVPQIKHPSSGQLDNENKARKSSEDKEELVTETLARIYAEQMLYHKAIVTYKKLMLKFPEKSLYFAGQIEQLENKIN